MIPGRRRLRLALTALSLAGLVVASAPAGAQEEGERGERHRGMHEMMDTMHGPGTSDRMHEMPGAEEMMDGCAGMMGGMMGGSGGGMMGGS